MNVILRGGVSVNEAVLVALLDLEARGATFTVTDDRVQILPMGLVDMATRAFLVTHKPEVLRILAYRADDHGGPT